MIIYANVAQLSFEMKGSKIIHSIQKIKSILSINNTDIIILFFYTLIVKRKIDELTIFIRWYKDININPIYVGVNRKNLQNILKIYNYIESLNTPKDML